MWTASPFSSVFPAPISSGIEDSSTRLVRLFFESRFGFCSLPWHRAILEAMVLLFHFPILSISESWPPRCLDERGFGSCFMVSFRYDKIFFPVETHRGFAGRGCLVLQPMGLSRDQK